MVAVNILVIAWVFIFQKDIVLAKALLLDPVSFLSILANIIIYAWINIWFFSGKKREEPKYVKYAIVGELIFVMTDLIYYYIIIYQTYEPNSMLDGGYILGFCLMAVSGLIKTKTVEQDDWLNKQQDEVKSFKRELIFLIVPLVIFLKEGVQSPILFFLILFAVFYFLLSNLVQTSIYHGRLLK